MSQYPIGFWNYISADKQGPEAVKDWADCGMTVAMGPEYDPANEQGRANMHAIMQEAAVRGVQIIHCHKDTTWRAMTRFGPEEYRRRAAAAIEEFGHYPSLMGFHVGDEPDLFMKKDFPDVVASFRTLNELSPTHRHFSNYLPWWPGIEQETYCPEQSYEGHLENYVRQGDVKQLCYDCYAQMKPDHAGWEMYFHNLFFYRTLAMKLGVPSWTTLLCSGHYDYKAPNEQEFRWQLHTAAAHGMQGVLWFRFYLWEGLTDYHGAPIDEHWERSQAFEWLSRVNRSFNKSLGPRFMELTHRGSWHVGFSFGGWPPFGERDDLVRGIVADGPMIYSRFTDAGGAPYIAIMNNSHEKAVFAHIRVDGRVKALHRVGWAGVEREEAVAARHAEFFEVRKWFIPAHLELYRVELGA